MATYKVTYTAHKSLIGGYKPIVLVNGQPQYFPGRNKKTERGALRVAKRLAEWLSVEWMSASAANIVTVSAQGYLK